MCRHVPNLPCNSTIVTATCEVSHKSINRGASSSDIQTRMDTAVKAWDKARRSRRQRSVERCCRLLSVIKTVLQKPSKKLEKGRLQKAFRDKSIYPKESVHTHLRLVRFVMRTCFWVSAQLFAMYVTVALTPSFDACAESSPGSSNLQAWCISLQPMVFLPLMMVTFEAFFASLSNKT